MWSIFPSPPPPLPTPRPAHSPPMRQPWPRRYGASRRVAGSPAYRCEKHTASDHRRCRPCTKPAQSTDADSRRLGFPDEAYAPPWKMWATSYRRRHRVLSNVVGGAVLLVEPRLPPVVRLKHARRRTAGDVDHSPKLPSCRIRLRRASACTRPASFKSSMLKMSESVGWRPRGACDSQSIPVRSLLPLFHLSTRCCLHRLSGSPAGGT